MGRESSRGKWDDESPTLVKDEGRGDNRSGAVEGQLSLSVQLQFFQEI